MRVKEAYGCVRVMKKGGLPLGEAAFFTPRAGLYSGGGSEASGMEVCGVKGSGAAVVAGGVGFTGSAVTGGTTIVGGVTVAAGALVWAEPE